MEEASDKKRVFICIDFSDEVIKEVARVSELVVKKKFTGKLVELENLHLTLKFLGEIDDKMLKKVKKKLGEIKFKEMELKLGEIGIFSHSGSPKIVWIKIEGKEIWDLQKQIDKSLKGLFAEEERFMSHFTIARVKYVKDKEDFVKHIKNISVKPIKFKIDRFKLNISDLKPMGAVYTTIKEYEAN